MSPPATIDQAIMDTVLGRIAAFFLAAAGNMTAAREAARQMLAAHHPETPDELTLAAEIVSLQFQTLEALSDAAEPDLSQNKVLRFRGGAIGLSRESHKAQRKLDQLQHARRAGTVAQPAEAPAAQSQPAPASPVVENGADQQEAVRQAIQIVKKVGGKNWLGAFQKRQAAERIAENLKKNQAQHAALATQAGPVAANPTAPAPAS